MPLVSTAIASMCLSLAGSGQYNESCNKAVEAYTKQAGTFQMLEGGERRTLEYATQMGEKNLGTTVMKTGAAGVFVYRVYKDKALTFKIKDVGIADSLTNHVTPHSYDFSLNWHF